MDIEYDSHIEDVPEIDFSRRIQPYMYEPSSLGQATRDSSSESEDEEGSEDEQIANIRIPDPSEWWVFSL